MYSCFLGYAEQYLHLLPEYWPSIARGDIDAVGEFVDDLIPEGEGFHVLRRWQPNAGCTRPPPLMQILSLFYQHLVAASCSTCAQDGLDTTTCAGGVFLPSASANTSLAAIVVISHCNLKLHWCFFPWSTSTFTTVHTNE